ncbi:MAG: hypothetical protein Q4A78_10145 [Peptostreptococcaceae bacterium]|nr:hypothetical protein [Peptostreptococcaceae bacterium]
MKKDEFPLLSPEEKDRAIARILDLGMPAHQGLFQKLKQTASCLSPSELFRGVEDALFLSLLLSLLAFFPLLSAATSMGERLESLLLSASPLLFCLLSLLIFWKEHQSGLLEWKQSCRLSFAELMTLRILLLSALCVLFLVPGVEILRFFTGTELSLLRMMALSCSGLFLYGSLALFCEALLPRRGLPLPPLLWSAAALATANSDTAARLLREIPTFLFIVLAAGSMAAFWKGLRIYCISHGGGSYALR